MDGLVEIIPMVEITERDTLQRIRGRLHVDVRPYLGIRNVRNSLRRQGLNSGTLLIRLEVLYRLSIRLV